MTGGSRGRLITTALVAMLALGVLAAPPSSGAAISATCGNLQSKLNAANTGDVITLHGVCTHAYTLPNKTITLQGATGAGFNGGGTVGPMLSGVDVRGTVIEDLSFKQGSNSSAGGAIYISGTSAPRITGCAFID